MYDGIEEAEEETYEFESAATACLDQVGDDGL